MDLNLTVPNFVYNPLNNSVDLTPERSLNIRLIMIFISYSTKLVNLYISSLCGVIYTECTVQINLMNIRLIVMCISYSKTSCHFVHFVGLSLVFI